MLRSHLKVGNGSDLSDGSDLRDAGYMLYLFQLFNVNVFMLLKYLLIKKIM